MKKLIFCLTVLLISLPAFAQLEPGQHIVGGRIGLGFQLENSGVSYSDNDRVDWGSLGAEYGLFYYYALTRHVSIGADISYGDFDGGELFESNEDVDNKTTLFNAMLSTRLTANPDDSFRFYLPLGIGMTSAQQHMHIKKPGIDFDKKATDTSLGWFVGAGFEFDLGAQSGWTMGLETRYNTFHYDTEKLTEGAPAAIQGDGNRRLSYMSFHLQVNHRF